VAFEQALGHGRSVHVEPARFEQQKHEEAAEPREGGYEEKQNEDVGVAGRARGLQRVGKIALLRQLQQTANHHEKNQHKLHPPTLPQIPTVPRVLEQTRYYLICDELQVGVFIQFAVGDHLRKCVVLSERLLPLSRLESCLHPAEFIRSPPTRATASSKQEVVMWIDRSTTSLFRTEAAHARQVQVVLALTAGEVEYELVRGLAVVARSRSVVISDLVYIFYWFWSG